MNTNQDTTLTNQDAFNINQPFVTQEQKFKYWEESKSHIKASEKRIHELTASNNQLRDALRKIEVLSPSHSEDGWIKEVQLHDGETCGQFVNEFDNEVLIAKIATKASSSTPTQSLAQHDNEVIEMCAVACESIRENEYCVDVRAGAEAIRALKVIP